MAETQQQQQTMTMASSSSGLTFKLHPLVIVNISDHHTRVKAQSQPPPHTCHQDDSSSSSTVVSGGGSNNNNRVFGCVIGVQRGRTVEIFNSFELLYDPVTNSLDRAFLENKQELYDNSSSSSSTNPVVGVAGGGNSNRVFGCVIGVQRGRTVEVFNSFELLYDPVTNSLDRAFLENKQELYKKVFPNFYILGWYSTGADAEESDMQIHKALMDINESPVYLLLNPLINHAQKDLPVTIYESEMHVIEGIPQLIFVRSSYTIETVEAERISVDHVAHLKPSDGGSAATQLAAHLTGIHSAIKMLNSRIRVLHHYLNAMQKGEIPVENSLLRQVSSLLRRLPAIESEKFQDDFLMEYNDTLLISYLAMFTDCSSTMNDLVDKINVAYEKVNRRGGRTAFM